MESVPQAEMYQRPEQQTARVLFGNATNFTRVRDMSEFQHYYERPLLMDAWAQTVAEDFDLVGNEYRQRNVELQREVNGLREKMRILEEDLRVHVQLLNQIHATAAIKTVLPRAETEFIIPTPTPPVTPVMQQQNVHYQQLPRRFSPTETALGRTATVVETQTFNGPQLINAAQMKTEGPNSALQTDSVKYTIVAGEQHDNNNCEPIEIHLAEEDGALNLNSSADSGRLEICLSTDEATEQQNQNVTNESDIRSIKEERHHVNTPPLPPLSGMLVKRCRLSNSNEASTSQQAQEAQFNYNGYSSECSSTASVISQPVIKETRSTQPKKRRSACRVSSERASSSQLPSTSIQTSTSAVRHHNDENVMVSIGPNNTRVPLRVYESISWDSASIATRKLLMSVFNREILATHSMTGKPSPAFKGQEKPQKARLDPQVTEDIIFVVTRRCKVSDKEVRTAITTKCADENKMMKLQLKKQRALCESNKENMNM